MVLESRHADQHFIQLVSRDPITNALGRAGNFVEDNFPQL